MTRHKQLWVGLVASVPLAFATLGSLAQAHGNDRGKASATIGTAEVTIDYGRPALRGREMLKKIQPGQLWRIGADAPTTIQSDTDLDFGGTRVPKGKHILLARLAEPGKWSLVVSSKDVFSYEPSAKIAEIPMEHQAGKDPVEILTVSLSSHRGRGNIEIAWGDSRLIASFAPAK